LLRELAQLLFAWLLRKSHQPPELNQYRKVPGRKNVRASLGEEQIDFRGPAADPLNLGQQRDRFLVVVRQAVEVELAGKDQLGKAANVAGLLPRHSGGAHLFVAGDEEQAKIGRRAECGFELGPHRPRCSNADLLADYGPEQRMCAGLACARLRHAVSLNDSG
jgi:hypothetical protein